MKCIKKGCSCEKFVMVKKGTQTGLYCLEGHFQKWVGKTDVRKYIFAGIDLRDEEV